MRLSFWKKLKGKIYLFASHKNFTTQLVIFLSQLIVGKGLQINCLTKELCCINFHNAQKRISVMLCYFASVYLFTHERERADCVPAQLSCLCVCLQS